MDVTHEGGVGKVLGTDAMDLILVLHHHDGNDGGHFAEQATGLDHAGFVVPTRQDFVAWHDHLEANGVVPSVHADKPLTQSPIADEPYASVLPTLQRCCLPRARRIDGYGTTIQRAGRFGSEYAP